MLGLALLAAGVLLFVAPGSSAAALMMRLWPVFLICAGVARVMGYAVERKPRSPIGGMLLIIVGVLFLVSRFHPASNAIEIYGRYWLLLLIVFGSVEVVRHYSHRQSYGAAPKLFTPGRLAVVLLIVATGVLASRVGRNPSLLTALKLRGTLGGLRDSVVGRTYTFTDDPVLLEIRPGKKIVVENRYGSVKVVGGASGLRATLVKGISAWSEDDALKTSSQIRLVTRDGSDAFLVTTNREELNRQFTTDIQIELPESSPLSIIDSYGSVSVSNIRSPVAVQASYGPVKIDKIAGDVVAVLSYSDFSASNVDGDVNATGFKRATAYGITGSVTLTGSNGSVDLQKIAGTVRVEAPLSKITLRDLTSSAEVKTDHGSVDATRVTDLAIEAPYSEIGAGTVDGNATVHSSHGDVKIASVSGDLDISAVQASVVADAIRGEAVIQTSHGEVSLKNFHAGARVATSYRSVTLMPAGTPGGNIEVNSSHGEIKLLLPASSQFQLDASSQNGRVRSAGFNNLTGVTGNSLTVSLGTNGPTIKLRTSYGDIVIQASGPSQVEANALVN